MPDMQHILKNGAVIIEYCNELLAKFRVFQSREHLA
jgi:hypothetical protein